MGRVEWGEPGAGEGTRSLMSDAYWRKPDQWNREGPALVFPSLCDPFDAAVPPAWRRRFMDKIAATPNLTWLLLTKRIGNVHKLTDPGLGERCLPRNAWIGATFVNQEEWDRDSRKLRAAGELWEIPTFASFEPLIGGIRFERGCWLPDWGITGGETSQGAHRARPTPDGAFQVVRDAFLGAGKLYHHKQNGAHLNGRYVGKRAAGRLLDGREYNDRPSPKDPLR